MTRIALMGHSLVGAVAARLIAEGYEVVEGDRAVVLTDGIGTPHVREIEEAVLASRAYAAKEVPAESYSGGTRKSKAEKLERKKRIQALQNGAFNKKRRKQG